ncbi:hypothetical protein [Vibrio tubiashii]|uniref:hypothetical protein n=1 Tax=Vibrio tubiashii TaxID=29498 RepID=UPI00349ED410
MPDRRAATHTTVVHRRSLRLIAVLMQSPRGLGVSSLASKIRRFLKVIPAFQGVTLIITNIFL